MCSRKLLVLFGCLVVLPVIHCFSPPDNKPSEDDQTNKDDQVIFDQILKANHQSEGNDVDVASKTSKELFQGDVKSSKDLFEGDIKKWKNFDADMKAMKKGVAFDALKVGKWADARIAYNWHPTMTPAVKKIVQQAIDEFNQKTCVRFVERYREPHYVQFAQGNGCYSYIGRTGGGQIISLGTGCHKKGIAVHEMMHAIGFWHEHSRRDRDQHVKIFAENINSAYIRNFYKYGEGTSNTYGLEYDKQSVMHYGNYAFSVNGNKTIVSLSNATEVLGQRVGMTELDVKGINAHYNCKDLNATTKPATTTQPPTTTEPATTKPETTIAPPTKCENKHPFCREISRFWCKDNAWMRLNCKERCQMCPPKCEDKSVFCWWWAQHYCNHSLYGPYMKKNCVRSCGHCK